VVVVVVVLLVMREGVVDLYQEAGQRQRRGRSIFKNGAMRQDMAKKGPQTRLCDKLWYLPTEHPSAA